MKVVSREELMKLIKTKDVLFSHIYETGLDGLYEASYFSGYDFVATDLISIIDGLDEGWLAYEYLMRKSRFSLDLECGGRDGMYDDKAKYAVYENQDIDKLIDRLNEIKTLER